MHPLTATELLSPFFLTLDDLGRPAIRGPPMARLRGLGILSHGTPLGLGRFGGALLLRLLDAPAHRLKSQRPVDSVDFPGTMEQWNKYQPKPIGVSFLPSRPRNPTRT